MRLQFGRRRRSPLLRLDRGRLRPRPRRAGGLLRKSLAACNKACAACKKEARTGINFGFNSPFEFRKYRFAGHDVYYVAKQVLAPAFCVSDHEMVMTLNLPAMKAYLTRKDHRPLATLPGVAAALNDRNSPVCLCYCDTPKLFDICYPLISAYASMGAAAAQQQESIDLDPTFLPSAPAIRAHLRPDITTIQRTPDGLQLTSRYCLPSGGNGLIWYYALSALVPNTAASSIPGLSSLMQVSPAEPPGPAQGVQSSPSGYSTSPNPYLPCQDPKPATEPVYSPARPAKQTPKTAAAPSIATKK